MLQTDNRFSSRKGHVWRTCRTTNWPRATAPTRGFGRRRGRSGRNTTASPRPTRWSASSASTPARTDGCSTSAAARARRFAGSQDLLGRYAELGLSPVSAKEFFCEQYFRNADHLAAYLAQGASLSNWRLPNRPYDADRDRAALELYARYNATPDGIRVLGQRKVLVLRRARVAYYPVDGAL